MKGPKGTTLPFTPPPGMNAGNASTAIANRARMPVARAQPRTLEDIALERFCLDFAWKSPRHAAALGLRLVWWMMPRPRFVPHDSPEVAAWNRMFDVEWPASSRDNIEPRTTVNVETPTTAEARILMNEADDLITQYVHGLAVHEIVLPRLGPFVDPDAEAKYRLYWSAEHHSSQLRRAAERFDQEKYKLGRDVYTDPDHQRYTARVIAALISMAELMEFLRKYATDNPSVGIADGAACNILRRIQLHLAHVQLPTTNVLEHLFTYRVRDALGERTLKPDVQDQILEAFRAAWLAGEYDFAYGLVDVEGLTVETPIVEEILAE